VRDRAAATVRGWLRRLRARVGQLLQEATSEFGCLVAVVETPEGRDPSPPGPAGSPLGDALALVVACALAAVRWHGRAEADLAALIGRFGLAATLAPAPAPGSRPWHPRARSRPATLIVSSRRHPGRLLPPA
jgi:hypothetical protein